VKLRDVAHARSGDKGDISNISVIAYRLEDFALLQRAVTPQVVKARLEGIARGDVVRHELPALGALNFVLHRALGGGVTRSMALDAHGKCLAAVLLDLDLPELSLMLPEKTRPRRRG
jgi:hypothetical protein